MTAGLGLMCALATVLGGCGMVHPNVLRAGELDPEEWSGFAVGFGIDRCAQMVHTLGHRRVVADKDLRCHRHSWRRQRARGPRPTPGDRGHGAAGCVGLSAGGVRAADAETTVEGNTVTVTLATPYP